MGKTVTRKLYWNLITEADAKIHEKIEVFALRNPKTLHAWIWMPWNFKFFQDSKPS